MPIAQDFRQSPILYLTVLVTGFLAGATVPEFILKWANLELVSKGSYVLKTQITGTVVVKKDAIREINNLVDQGVALKDDQGAIVTWLLQVSTFVHYLGLPLEVDVEGEKISHLEKSLLFAQSDRDLKIQVKRTLGILKGFLDAEQARLSSE